MVHFVHQYTPPEEDPCFSPSDASGAQYYSGFKSSDISELMQARPASKTLL